MLGDLEDGSREAQVLLRAYGQCLRQLLRAANWDFARKQAPLTLLADASGNTPDVGTTVDAPWLYAYAYPIDCLKARFVPANGLLTPPIPAGNIQIPTTPLTTGFSASPLVGQRLRPTRFTVAVSSNYPTPPGDITWEVQGISPQGRTVILSNQQQAVLIYTALMIYVSNWDVLFRSAMVAYLASEVCLAIWAKRDLKIGMQLRAQQIAIAKEKIVQARITDGNEGVYSSDIQVDWLAFRRTGGYGGWTGNMGGLGGGAGVLGFGWDQCSFSDGSAF